MLQEFVIIQRKAIADDFKVSTKLVSGLFASDSSGHLSGQSSQTQISKVSHSQNSWFQFKTCLRNILVGPKDSLAHWQRHEDDEIFQGEKAYQFLLEVIAGLHSSLIGETEILGQFKNAVIEFKFPESHFGLEMKKFFQALLEDVKKVRSQHLADLGSQSYGSILRKEMKKMGETELHIIGAGHLCEEILPWVAKDGLAVHIHVRNVERGRQKFKNPKLNWHQLDGSENIGSKNQIQISGALIVAAPLGAKKLQEWIDRSAGLMQVFDLRHDSDLDRLQKTHF